MKVLFFSDPHGSERALKLVARVSQDFDAVIAGGDLSGGVSPEYVPRLLGSMVEKGKPLLFVPGNADSPELVGPPGSTPLHGVTARLGNRSIGGLGGSNITPFHTRFELEDSQAEDVLSKLGPVDILVSHCPPKGCKCDKVGRDHIGSLPVRRYVDSRHPLLVLSGHVHEAPSVDNLGGTTVVNPGALKDGRFAALDLNGVLSVELKAEPLNG